MIPPKIPNDISDSRKTKFVMGGLFEKGEINLLVGRYATGKSSLMTRLCAEESKKGANVLYFASESYTHIVEKFKAIQYKDGCILSTWITGGVLDMTNYLSVEKLVAFCKEASIEILVIDTLFSAMGKGTMNDDSKVAEIYNALRRQLAHKGITVILVTHPTKGSNSFAGAYQWGASVPVIWNISKGKLVAEKFRNNPNPPKLSFKIVDYKGTGIAELIDKPLDSLTDFQSDVLALATEYGFSSDEEVANVKTLLVSELGYIKNNSFHNKFAIAKKKVSELLNPDANK